jgi:AcrR family transcriptional regulator
VRTLPTAISSREAVIAETFATRGFEDTRMEDLAEATGVPKATLYYHFAGKEEILAWLLRSTLAATLMHADRVVLLDVHTGLGSYGGCQLICGIEEGNSRVADVRRWLGDGALFFGTASGYERMAGAIDSGIAAASPPIA